MCDTGYLSQRMTSCHHWIWQVWLQVCSKICSILSRQAICLLLLSSPISMLFCNRLGKAFGLVHITFKEQRLNRQLPDWHWRWLFCLWLVCCLFIHPQLCLQLLYMLLHAYVGLRSEIVLSTCPLFNPFDGQSPTKMARFSSERFKLQGYGGGQIRPLSCIWQPGHATMNRSYVLQMPRKLISLPDGSFSNLPSPVNDSSGLHATAPLQSCARVLNTMHLNAHQT